MNRMSRAAAAIGAAVALAVAAVLVVDAPTLGGAQGRFRAATAGTSTLTAVDAPRCAPMCKIADRMWTVAVNVTSSGGHATASDTDNGRTMTLHRGDTLTVTLHSTYWTVNGSSNSAVVTG